MKLITLYIPEPYLKALDQLINERYYPNRAEAIRVAIRDLLQTEKPTYLLVDGDSVEVWDRISSDQTPEMKTT